jgi:hypothetical protein
MTTLGDALEAHYGSPAAKHAAELHRREVAASGWAPDPRLEADLAAQARDPKAWDRSFPGLALGLSIYSEGRDAAIALGSFTPTSAGDAE